MTGSTRTTWLLAGQDLLRSRGIGGVKIDALVEVTGLTTGSFYHHFPNMAAYRDALAEFYARVQVDETLSAIDETDPHRRLRRIADVARRDSLGALDAAMRDWAGSDDVAAAAVRLLDATLLGHFARAFEDMGHDRASARVRAVALLAAGVARVHPPWPLQDPTEALLAVLER